MFSFSDYEFAVRAAKPLGYHNVIRCYVHMGLERAKTMQSCHQTRAAHLRVVDTLTETLCDSCLPNAWRAQCFVVLKQLFPLLHVILSSAHFTKKVTEIRRLADYFLETKTPSLVHNKTSNKLAKP